MVEREGSGSDDERPEGVRIIGADEAAEALERGDVAHRRGVDEPKYGDRPAPPPSDGPRPALRFPLSSDADASDIVRPPVEPVELPHWTEPATGQVPTILGGTGQPEEADDADDWSSFSTNAPRWRDSSTRYEGDQDDVGMFGDGEAPLGALDESDRPSHEDFFSFAELDEPPAGRSVFATEEDEDDDLYADEFVDETVSVPIEEVPRRRPAPGPRRGGRPPARGDRDMGAALAVGVGLAAVALFLFKLGPTASMLIVVPVIVLAAVELFAALRRAGYQPVTLLGLVATAGLVIGAYHRGEAALPVVLFLTVVFSLVWFLAGVETEAPVLNVGVTVLGVVWVGMFGSYAALMLRAPNGVGLLLGAIVGTVAYDVGGLLVGRNAGTRPLSAASPNKTMEGLGGGMLVAVVVCVLFSAGLKVDPFTGLSNGLKLGIVVALAAPLGDLCESLVKRDLGIKDMGTILPGHGGLLDRFDALLFVLPAVYYLARLTDFFK